MLSRTRAFAAATAISLVFVAGCGASGGDNADKTTTTARNGTTTTAGQQSGEDNGVADLTADEILKKAQDALHNAGSVKVTGNVKSDGQAFGIDMSIGQGGANGTITVGGNKVELVVTKDTVYLKGDEEFYKSIARGKGDSAAAAKLLAGKWLSVDAGSEQAKDFAQFADFDGFVDSFLDPSGKVTKGETGDIDGTPAIALEDDSGDEPGQLWVATKGEPYPLQVNKKGDSSQKISLTEHGETVDLTPPPASDVISLDELQSMGGGSGN